MHIYLVCVSLFQMGGAKAIFSWFTQGTKIVLFLVTAYYQEKMKTSLPTYGFGKETI